MHTHVYNGRVDKIHNIEARVIVNHIHIVKLNNKRDLFHLIYLLIMHTKITHNLLIDVIDVIDVIDIKNRN